VLLVMDAVKAAEIAQTRHRLDREKQLRVKSRGVKLTDISKLLASTGQVTIDPGMTLWAQSPAMSRQKIGR